MKNLQPKFEDSDAYLFFKVFEKTGDTQVCRQFCKSMKIWNKTLISSSQKGQEQE